MLWSLKRLKSRSKGVVFLVDFGIAKVGEVTRTMTGALGVTPGFSPPEQYAMTGTDARSDIYALGATLYALLTAQTPPESVVREFGEKLVPPRQINNTVSPAVQQAVFKAMERRPTHRPQSVTEFRRMLEERGAKSAERNPLPLLLAGAGIVATVLVVLIVVAISSSKRAATLAPMPGTTTTAEPTKSTEPTKSPVVSSTPVPPTRAIETTTSPEPTKVPVTQPPAIAPGATRISEKDGMVMMYVPAGEFLMGSADSDKDAKVDEKPQHKVYLDAFWVDRTEVTNAMFKRFVTATSHKTEAEKEGWGYAWRTGSTWEQVKGADWQHPRGPSTDLNGLDTHPVVQVSWNDATAYCEWAGRRLPTEAQWEKAARGTDGRTYPWGNQSVAGNLLNFADRNLSVDWADKTVNDGYEFTAPVGNYPAGASLYGALDMAGNVWEWVSDWYAGNYYASSPSKNPSGPSSGSSHVLRGGVWYVDATYVRAATRHRDNPINRNDNYGFRCVGWSGPGG